MRRLMLLVLLGMLLVACDQAATPKPTVTQPTTQSGNATQQPAGNATDTGGYPAPNNAYPAPTDGQTADGYPAPAAQGPQFTINTPVSASDSQVTGKGPAGVPIKLINMSKSSELIGEVTIGSDGAFTVNAASKLIAGDRIALMLGNTAGTNVDPSKFISGPGYQDYPLIGVTFASTVVQ
jgi:hypothetical protein